MASGDAEFGMTLEDKKPRILCAKSNKEGDSSLVDGKGKEGKSGMRMPLERYKETADQTTNGKKNRPAYF